MRHGAAQVTEELFPASIAMAGATLPLKYRFAPGDPQDGVTLTVPLALLNQLDVARLTWLVPGMIRDKVAAYLKALPKALRNRLVPVPEVVTAFLTRAAPGAAPLDAALRAYLEDRLAGAIPAQTFDAIELPAHFRFNVRVVDAGGIELAAGRDLKELRAKLGEAAQLSFAAAGPTVEKKGLRAWDFGDLPPSLTMVRDGARLTGYPALVDDETSVSLALFDTPETAEASMRAGVIRLVRLQQKDALARYEKGAPGFAQAALQLKATVPTPALLADVISAVVDRAFIGDPPARRACVRRSGEARAHAVAGGRRRRVSPACRHRGCALCAVATSRRRAAVAGADRGRIARRAGPARPPRLLLPDTVGTIASSATLLGGARTAFRAPRRAAGARRAARGANRRVAVALS